MLNAQSEKVGISFSLKFAKGARDSDMADETGVPERTQMPDQPEMPKKAEPMWYVVHTYSGYENKVKANIEKTIENRHLEDQILEVRVPLQEVIELKNGKARPVQKKLFPGYVLLHMVMNDDTWYVVRNTRGVTGFVGPGSKAVPLTETELAPVSTKEDSILIDFEVGDRVTVMDKAWEGRSGIVTDINMELQKATVNLGVFSGRDTPVEFDFLAIKKE